MAVNTAKKRAKAHAIMNKKADEPVLDQDNYNVSIGSALVWYTNNTDDKTRRKYAIEYFAGLGKKKEVLAINKASDYDVRQVGILCRLLATGNKLSEEHEKMIFDRVNDMMTKNVTVKEIKPVDVPVVPVVSIQERMEEKARDLSGEIEAALDEFTLKKKSDFSTKNYLLANQVAAPIAKRIGEFYVKLSKELHEAILGEDEQLVEGYSHFNKRQLKAFSAFVDGIISDCQQMVQTAKATRTPRQRKAVPASKQVAKVKYMKEFAELNLKSVLPSNIIGSSELWVYNTKYRRVTVYKSDSSLAVKGTTIIGFNVKESKTMTLRKPEEFFKGLSLGKRALGNAFKALTTKPSVPNGRINEECILLGAF